MLNPEELEEFLAHLKNPVNGVLIRKILQGNQNWIHGNPTVLDQREIRRELIASQEPKIIVLTCADSRVSPNYIFDASIGNMFVIRVAGNVVSPEILASIEFSITELGSTLICILGHESCGAVQSKIQDSKQRFVSSNNLLSVLNRINVNTNETLTNNIISNIKRQSELVKLNSFEVSAKYAEGSIDIIGMYYSLETGQVHILDVKMN